MPSQVLPADLKAALPDPNSSLCGNLVAALIRIPTLIYTFFAWMLTSTGTLSKAFINGVLPSGSLTFSASLLNEDGSRLLCDGREVSRTDFADLFAAIGTSYGTPSGSSVFKIPDYRARFPVGIGSFAN